MKIKSSSIILEAMNAAIESQILNFTQALVISAAVEYCANRQVGDRSNDQEEGISEFLVESCQALVEID